MARRGRQMKPLPFDIGTLHFVGIGGIGMSGIAEVLHNLGYRVQGSDILENQSVKRLQDLGIPISIGHKEENLGSASVVIVSSAVQEENLEIQAARRRFIPVVPRADMLSEIMRLKWSVSVAGTHGKTTTTSLVAAILEAAGCDPTVINGGVINAYGTNVRLGAGDWVVAEADESDGAFLKLPSTVAIVTNIDPEHLEYYGSFEALCGAFREFIERIPFYGFAVMCDDDPAVRRLVQTLGDRRIITYGVTPRADVCGVLLGMDTQGVHFEVFLRGHEQKEETSLGRCRLPMPGRHNMLNALAAIATAEQLSIEREVVMEALRMFRGVQRRFTKRGMWNGVSIYDDYGHHPTEIAAVLETARELSKGRVFAVVQPHRYSRLEALFDEFCRCFGDADTVIIAPVYAAGEVPLKGVNRDTLAAGIQGCGHGDVRTVEGPEELPPMICGAAQKGDVVVCLGAGNITTWAQALPQTLRQEHGV